MQNLGWILPLEPSGAQPGAQGSGAPALQAPAEPRQSTGRPGRPRARPSPMDGSSATRPKPLQPHPPACCRFRASPLVNCQHPPAGRHLDLPVFPDAADLTAAAASHPELGGLPQIYHLAMWETRRLTWVSLGENQGIFLLKFLGKNPDPVHSTCWQNLVPGGRGAHALAGEERRAVPVSRARSALAPSPSPTSKARTTPSSRPRLTNSPLPPYRPGGHRAHPDHPGQAPRVRPRHSSHLQPREPRGSTSQVLVWTGPVNLSAHHRKGSC